MTRIRGKFTYANVMATLAVFFVLGGGAYAAAKLPKNSVGSRQLKKNAVTTTKIGDEAVTGDKIKLSSLGTVPSATTAVSATTAASASRAASAADASSLGGVAANHYVRPGAVLASGDKEIGVFATSAPNGSFGSVAITFTQKLPAPVFSDHAELLDAGESSAACPGPRQAAPGHFCIYLDSANGMSFSAFASTFPTGDSQVIEPEGAVLFFSSTRAVGNVRGNWAYTAP